MAWRHLLARCQKSDIRAKKATFNPARSSVATITLCRYIGNALSENRLTTHNNTTLATHAQRRKRTSTICTMVWYGTA
eukprot:scaffold8099_cov162-Amphora_coffeaeformis.AAC.3